MKLKYRVLKILVVTTIYKFELLLNLISPCPKIRYPPSKLEEVTLDSPINVLREFRLNAMALNLGPIPVDNTPNIWDFFVFARMRKMYCDLIGR